MAQKSNRIQVMLDDENAEKLRKAAEQDNRSVSDYLRLVIEAHFNE